MPAGKFYDAASRGKVWSVSTVVAGLAIPVSTTTAPTVAILNPLGSGVMVNLVRFNIGAASGTVAAGVVGLQRTDAANITVFTDTTPKNARYPFGGVGARARASAAGTNTLAAAVVQWECTMFELTADVVATGDVEGNLLSYDFDGLVQLAPGAAMFVAATQATSALFSQTLWWEEISLTDIAA